ncbi:MAG TPA: SPOR domain-containing protein [Deferrisomatales bacterium]|nr:SPOR domain-containing protein [Deferrisomatales bacterium]
MRAYRKVNDQYEFRVDGGRLTLLGVGAALVVLLVFLLGVLVGKALWGGRRSLPPLPQAQTAPAPAPTPAPAVPDPAVAEPAPHYSFYEELKKPDPVAPPPEPVRPPTAGATAAAEPPAAPAPPPKPKPAPQAGPKQVVRPPPVVFTVQVGSFRDRAAASDLARRVGTQGVSANVSEAFVAGRTWYRVQVGTFETRSDAENYYRSGLRRKGVQGFVTTR